MLNTKPSVSAKPDFEKHSSGLVRRLGAGAVFLLVVSSMVGSGVFKKVAPMSSELGSAQWVLLAWIVAGCVTWFGALTNAEIGSQIAEPGGSSFWFCSSLLAMFVRNENAIANNRPPKNETAEKL